MRTTLPQYRLAAIFASVCACALLADAATIIPGSRFSQVAYNGQGGVTLGGAGVDFNGDGRTGDTAYVINGGSQVKFFFYGDSNPHYYSVGSGWQYCFNCNIRGAQSSSRDLAFTYTNGTVYTLSASQAGVVQSFWQANIGVPTDVGISSLCRTSDGADSIAYFNKSLGRVAIYDPEGFKSNMYYPGDFYFWCVSDTDGIQGAELLVFNRANRANYIDGSRTWMRQFTVSDQGTGSAYAVQNWGGSDLDGRPGHDVLMVYPTKPLIGYSFEWIIYDNDSHRGTQYVRLDG